MEDEEQRVVVVGDEWIREYGVCVPATGTAYPCNTDSVCDRPSADEVDEKTVIVCVDPTVAFPVAVWTGFRI